MKISFTGDVFFSDSLKKNKNPFQNIIDRLHNPVINLESVFLPDSYKEGPIKNKVCLRAPDESIEGVKLLNPRLINLANNHMNDFGNFGVENTKSILRKNNYPFFGVGLTNEEHNVFVDEELKTVFYAYTTRSCDLTGSVLFNAQKEMGSKEYSLDYFKKQSSKHDDYKKVVLFHWGIEHTHYPLPEQVILAHDLVEAGADLIIGNHAHAVQSYEKYNDKWIFYALGNFYFPEFSFKENGQNYIASQARANRISIVPTFEFTESGIDLVDVDGFYRENDNTLTRLKQAPNYKRLFSNKAGRYRFYYKSYMAVRFLKKAATYPYRRIKRALGK